MLKILIATNMYPTAQRPYLGAFVQQQETSLRALGCAVHVAAHVAGGGAWGKACSYARGLRELTALLRTEPFDLIHTHHTYSTALALAARTLARRRLPIIQTFHESDVFRRQVYGQQGPLQRLRYNLRLKAWALRHVDFALPVQRDMLRVVLGEEGAGHIPHAVVPAGIDLGSFAALDRNAARKELNWDPRARYVFFPCDPAKPEKRHDLALAGFELYRHSLPAQERPNMRFIVGGQIPYAQMPLYLAACDVVLVPTDYEASPTVVKEALACERAVVSTDVGDVRQCYGDLPGVQICDWTPQDVADKLRAALTQSTEPFGGRARIEALGLDLPQVARCLVQVYEQVLATVPNAAKSAKE